jgi:hypothetical protein
MSIDFVEELRKVHKELADLRQRLARTIVSGTVAAVEGDRVRLSIGFDGAEDILSPWVRIGLPSGKNGGGHSVYTRPGIGEPMLLVSPGGKIGQHSRAMFFGPVDDHPSPGTAEADGFVHQVGDVRQEIKDGHVRTDVAGQSVTLSRDSGIALDAKDQSVSIGGETKQFEVSPPARFAKTVSMGGGGEGQGDLVWEGNITVKGIVTAERFVGPFGEV